MKKIIFGLLITLAASFTMNAQDKQMTDSESFSKWQVRLRALVVSPDESATIEAIGGDVDISTSVIPELDITYFFTKNIAAELVLGTTKHDVEAVETAAGNIDLGSVWLLPPTLTVQYHFTGGALKPYLGAGINYTIFYSADEGPVADDMDYDNSVGLAFQAGLDFDLNDNWFLNVDLKKVYMNTDATVNATTALGATVVADVDINPLLIGFGVGYRF
ncbi:OmpW family outer membrane protein [Maribacter sp.]|uniref:OmpW/AlkL family protein n=1 Tax=Maribacter sp. TaxID=1897614 RepID=UPI0025BD9580|nr:OmpW family outer membrane protein [Maribacter sp.]